MLSLSVNCLGKFESQNCSISSFYAFYVVNIFAICSVFNSKIVGISSHRLKPPFQLLYYKPIFYFLFDNLYRETLIYLLAFLAPPKWLLSFIHSALFFTSINVDFVNLDLYAVLENNTYCS